MKNLGIWVLAGLMILLSLPSTSWADGKLKITYGQNETEMELKQNGTEWTATEGADVFVIDYKNGKEFSLTKNGKALASGTLATGKLALTGDSFFLELKFKEEKIKVFSSSGAMPYEIKMKEDKVKVVWSELEYGKVKFYADTQKLKAKDKDDTEVAVMKDAGKLRSALAAFFNQRFNSRSTDSFDFDIACFGPVVPV